jgi:hypothetical protein
MHRPARQAYPRHILKVELRAAPLPFIGAIAVHCWFVVAGERWEVWQTKNAGGTCIGHVHRGLKPPEDGVGGGPSHVVARWEGDAAQRIAAVLNQVEKYPYRERYRSWPGPNSNTFVAWVLREARVEHRLPWRALGRNYFR